MPVESGVCVRVGAALRAARCRPWPGPLPRVSPPQAHPAQAAPVLPAEPVPQAP